uniref:Uncharacterized protein n=1 Tax=Nelumbo nucifera TaxID=4432 RepID=A0A822ZGY2_NELNU|nr:TPA_asm: hypothetical protein HUJ06_001980 [Nelumbo nucifera]
MCTGPTLVLYFLEQKYHHDLYREASSH